MDEATELGNDLAVSSVAAAPAQNMRELHEALRTKYGPDDASGAA